MYVFKVKCYFYSGNPEVNMLMKNNLIYDNDDFGMPQHENNEIEHLSNRVLYNLQKKLKQSLKKYHSTKRWSQIHIINEKITSAQVWRISNI